MAIRRQTELAPKMTQNMHVFSEGSWERLDANLRMSDSGRELTVTFGDNTVLVQLSKRFGRMTQVFFRSEPDSSFASLQRSREVTMDLSGISGDRFFGNIGVYTEEYAVKIRANGQPSLSINLAQRSTRRRNWERTVRVYKFLDKLGPEGNESIVNALRIMR